MTQITLALVMVAAAMALLDWRRGLAICVLIGIAQDPLRKLAPGQPIYYVVLVGVIFAAAWMRAALTRVPLTPSAIHGWRENLMTPFSVFMFLVAAQAVHSFARYDSARMAGIGLLVWLAPIPAVMLAYQYAMRRGIMGVRRWMLLYVIVAAVSLSGVYLEYAGYDWRTLGEIGEGQILYDFGGMLRSNSGFFRSSEIAAWHTAAMSCFVFILFVGKRPTILRVAMALVVIGMLVTLGILTGRRKMLVEIIVFISFYLFLVAWLQRGMARLAMVVLIMGAIGYIGVVGFVEPDLVRRPVNESIQLDEMNRMEGYAARGQSVFADLPGRVNQLGVQPVMNAIHYHGWLGAGLGTGSQGANDIAAAHNINRYAAEGGLGKVAMELGVPGLLMMIWLAFALAKHLGKQLVVTAAISPQHARVSYGLVAFLVANAAAFSVATQAYSDLFILLILGWCLGFLLAMRILAERGDGLKRRAQPQRWPGGMAGPAGTAPRGLAMGFGGSREQP
jgi:hypothetical protein